MINEFDFDIIVNTERLCLKTLDVSSAGSVLAYYNSNRDAFSRYMPGLSDKFFTLDYHISAMLDELEQLADGKSFRLFIFKADDYEYKNIIGDIYVSNIEKRHRLCCEVSYKLSHNCTGNGYMTEALKALTNYLFNKLSLHRIELHILPENNDSIRLARRLNFRQEGIVRDYVFLNGKWCDHIRFSLINEAKK